MFGFFPKDDHDQALRIKRFLMAFGSYVMWSTLIADKKETCCTWYKNIKSRRFCWIAFWSLFYHFLIIILIHFVCFTTALRARYNSSSKLPSQMTPWRPLGCSGYALCFSAFFKLFYRILIPISFAYGMNSTNKYYCIVFVIFESKIPRRYAPGIVPLTLPIVSECHYSSLLVLAISVLVVSLDVELSLVSDFSALAVAGGFFSL